MKIIGYNMTFGGEATLGWSPTEETKLKISESNKGRIAWNKGKICSWVSDRNISQTGIPKPKLYKTYIITSPEGKIYNVKGLVKFCKEYRIEFK